jgi:hypothetical protein
MEFYVTFLCNGALTRKYNVDSVNTQEEALAYVNQFPDSYISSDINYIDIDKNAIEEIWSDEGI